MSTRALRGARSSDDSPHFFVLRRTIAKRPTKPLSQCAPRRCAPYKRASKVRGGAWSIAGRAARVRPMEKRNSSSTLLAVLVASAAVLGGSASASADTLSAERQVVARLGVEH